MKVFFLEYGTWCDFFFVCVNFRAHESEMICGLFLLGYFLKRRGDAKKDDAI